jgi:hypothetical protein
MISMASRDAPIIHPLVSGTAGRIALLPYELQLELSRYVELVRAWDKTEVFPIESSEIAFYLMLPIAPYGRYRPWDIGSGARENLSRVLARDLLKTSMIVKIVTTIEELQAFLRYGEDDTKHYGPLSCGSLYRTPREVGIADVGLLPVHARVLLSKLARVAEGRRA